MSGMRTIHVNLPGRAYPVWVGDGLLKEAGDLVARREIAGRIAVVADEEAAKFHLETLLRSLKQAGHRLADPVTIEAGEGSKSMERYQSLMESLLDREIGRDGAVVALGGGMVGDLAGFAAATLYRGVALVQAPTTLLAQVDSAIGGKTGVNAPHGKNLIGAFHQPSCVIADSAVLDTLPERELRAGYAEVAKVAALGDGGFFDWLERSAPIALAGKSEERSEMVTRAAAIKAAIVSQDETEQGRRALLNLGHTIGHAVEAAEGYRGGIRHGEAVAVGMVVAAELSRRMEWCSDETPLRLRIHLRNAGLPARLADLNMGSASAEELLDLARQDKKYRAGRPTLVLLRALGEAELCRDPDMPLLQKVVEESLRG